jgi:ketosteroid isomerase-like protein
VSRHRLLLLATLMAAGTPSCQRPSPERDTAADKQRVSQVGEREIRALSAANVDSNLAVLTADVVMMPPNQKALTGSDAVRSWLREGHDQFKFDFRYTDSQVDIADDWAIERYTGTGTITPKKGGRPIEERVKGIHIYRRQPDGSWLIAQDVWNSDLAPSGHP